MMLYVDRFNNNLKGFTEKLDYFDELGINLLHLMPLMSSPKYKNDGGYAVSNFKKVDPKYGTNADLLSTAKALHSRGKFLMLDFVVNHTSDEHIWAQKARKGDKYYQDYFILTQIVPFPIYMSIICRRFFLKVLLEILHGIRP